VILKIRHFYFVAVIPKFLAPKFGLLKFLHLVMQWFAD
jgi:hypothetical protein